MAKKDYFLIIDTETTIDQMVADFGAVVCDRKGKIYTQCAVLVNGIYTDMQNHPLFYVEDSDPVWSKASLETRYNRYNEMVKNGSRMIASVNAINLWLAKAIGKYDPILTAYNLAFDTHKCGETGIDLTGFSQRFCLWYASAQKWAHTRNYRQFILDNHYFNKPTKLGNMSYQTNAEVMARFVTGQPDLEDEPHTALEDVIDYELPILTRLVKTTKKDDYINPIEYDWNKMQVKDWFKV